MYGTLHLASANRRPKTSCILFIVRILLSTASSINPPFARISWSTDLTSKNTWKNCISEYIIKKTSTIRQK
ncbi:hypothetical protein M758_10G138200 [Ceratodon purpureus]|uniref:Uncharacterized protein n=1 Tax=Ceratodon purpureus TaxID=3225 RepID=A0A8T0GK96_CERPU|nr:hypothetical protein KC19_10G143000 [Ceratodon purpureus]KAG0604024.1 hypothetical protein M758_10G138200 [Ceratodon purpureus]